MLNPIRSSRIFLAALVCALLALPLSGAPVQAGDLDGPRAAGTVGEGADGFAVIRTGSADAALKDLVSAINAKSLEGGTLMMTPLLGPRSDNPTVYAMAQGPLKVSLDGPPTNAVIQGGAKMEMNVEAGLTLKAGCGIGYEFSTLRPKGAYVSGAGAHTSGPLSFMDITIFFNTM